MKPKHAVATYANSHRKAKSPPPDTDGFWRKSA
jgi:hypothetical protein